MRNNAKTGKNTPQGRDPEGVKSRICRGGACLGCFYETCPLPDEGASYGGLGNEAGICLNVVIDTLYDGVLVLDKTGKIVRINPGISRVTGLPPETFLSQSVMELYERGYFSEVPIAYQALKEGRVKNGIQEISTGKRVMITATPVFDTTGEVLYVVVDARDFTELQRLKEELDKAKYISDLYRTKLIQLAKDRLAESKIVARSKAMLEVLEMALRVAPTDATVLLLGESGVGKEVIAEFIYQNSGRSEHGPFLKLNCNSVPKELVESELFGYERGAFTGASASGKPGLLEMADGGTLFLDEIADLPLDVQGKFLRVLEKNEFKRLGGTKDIKVDVRIIAATHRDLSEMVQKGFFRQDLYYRLSVVPIHIPPLRERPEDINVLVGVYLKQFNEKHKSNKHLSGEALQALREYHWPGNVRELVNLLERLVIMSPHDLIDVTDLPERLFMIGRESTRSAPLKRSMEEVEKYLLAKAKREHGSCRNIAKAIGLSHTAVQKKLKKYGLS